MKKCFLCLTLFILILLTHISQAQIFTAKGGFNLANVKTKRLELADGLEGSKAGFHVGIIAEFPINTRFSIETGLLYSNVGSQVHLQDTLYDTRFRKDVNYLNAPVNFKCTQKFKNNLKVFATAGTYVGMALYGRTHFETTYPGGYENYKDNIDWATSGERGSKRFDYGATFGFGIERKRIQFAVSYDMGLAKIFDLGSILSQYNRVYKFSLGYRFGKRFRHI